MNGSYQFEHLTGRHHEAQMLKTRAQLRLDGFTDLAARHGATDGQKILEIGCAQGIRTKILSNQFTKSSIVGLDRSPELLKEAETNNFGDNIQYVEGNVYHLPFDAESFDFVYVRLVFMHLNQPLVALAEISRVLRPGGRVLIEDADRDCMFFEPAPRSFKWFWDVVQQAQLDHGGDPNVGRKLATYLKQSHFTSVFTEIQPITGGGPEIKFLAETLLPSLNLYLDKSIQTRGHQAIKDVIVLSEQQDATFYHFWFAVSGKKSSNV